MIFGLPPTMIIALGVMVLAASIAAGVVARRNIRGKLTAHFYFDRNTGVEFKHGDNTSGLVTSPDGGYLERPDAVVHMRTGRPMFERGERAWRRGRKPVYLVRAGDSAPMTIHKDGSITIDNVDGDEFDARLNLAAELAVAEGTKKAARGDFVGRIVAVSILVLTIALAAVVVAVVVKGEA